MRSCKVVLLDVLNANAILTLPRYHDLSSVFFSFSLSRFYSGRQPTNFDEFFNIFFNGLLDILFN